MKTSIVKSLLAIPVLILLVAASARADSGVKDPVRFLAHPFSPCPPQRGLGRSPHQSFPDWN